MAKYVVLQRVDIDSIQSTRNFHAVTEAGHGTALLIAIQ